MDSQEYEKLAKDLQDLARIIPLRWGNIQNDRIDRKINMFNIHSFSELENAINHLEEFSKTYYRRRWFLWKCAQCDEYLFYRNNNVKPNPNPRDQSYDIEFNDDEYLRFDVKGTIIPRDFRTNTTAVLNNPSNIVKFFYEKQSKGVRFNIQNRLFLVHHSFVKQEREMYLRCHWEFKKQVFEEYSNKISQTSKFITYNNVIADVIFIIENSSRDMSFHINSI